MASRINQVPEPPEGFVLETDSIPPPPEGFVAEGAGKAEPSFMEKAKDIVTGERRGRGIFPELGSLSDIAPTEMGDIKSALGFFATPDIEARKDILRKNIPGVTFGDDEYGNTIVALPDGRLAYLNAPGFSVQDFADLGSEIVKFLPAAKFAGGGASILGRVGRGVVGGGATSIAEDIAAEPLGSEQGIDPERAALTSTLTGGVEAIAPGLTGAARFFGRRFKRLLGREEVPPEQALPLTRGQRTGDPKQLAREEALRARTDEAGQMIREFDQRQQQRLRDIVGEVQEDLAASGRSPVIGSEREGGQFVAETINENAQKMLLAIDEAFDIAAGAEARVTREGLNLLGNTRQRIQNMGFDIDSDLFPATSRALGRLEKLKPKSIEVETGILTERGTPITRMEDVGISSQSLEELNTTRKVIGRLINSASSNEDRYGATLVKRELDDFIDDVFDKALFEGDTEALRALKETRGLRAEFGKRFERRDIRTTSGKTIQDEAGKIIESIVKKKPTDEEVVNSIFGASQLFSKRSAADVVKRMRNTVDDPEQLNGVLKQLVFRRLVRPALRDGGFMPNRFARSLDETMERNGTLLETVYSPGELAALHDFKNEALKTAKASGVMNTTEFSDKLTRTLGRLGVVFGLQRGGIGFGSVGGSFGRGIGQGISRRIARRQAQEAISDIDMLPGRPNNFTISTMIAASRPKEREKNAQSSE